MALPSYLENIKSSGIYRFVFDKTATPAGTVNPKRLFVGYSEKGPVNTPVMIDSVSDFKKIYGDVNKKLERYGCYFHRSCLQALGTEPIYCLNVKTFNNESVQGITFDSTGITRNEYKVSNIYDKSRFWYLEPKNLKVDGGKSLYLSTTDSENCSNTIFIKGFKPKGYNITFKEWFSTIMNGEELPSYLEGYESEKLEDYFVKIYVFGGDINAELVGTDFYKKYFEVEDGVVKAKETIKNAFGEYVDALDLFASNSKSNLVGIYSGIVLPDFVTSNNQALSIVDIFNSDNSKHKMMMYQDVDSLYEEQTSLDNLKFSNQLSQKATAYYLKGYKYELLKPSSSTDNESKLKWQDSILSALKGVEETISTQVSEINFGGTYYDEDGEKVNFDTVLAALNTYLGGRGYSLDAIYTDAGCQDPLNTGDIDSIGSKFANWKDGKWEVVDFYYKGETDETYTIISGDELENVISGVEGEYLNKALYSSTDQSVTKFIGYKGLRVALTDRTSIDYRYMVDTFETFITTQIKSILSNICKEKENALAILNFPKAEVIKSFSTTDLTGTVYPFVNKDLIDFSVMVDSTNKEIFSLADEDNGASYCAYYTPVNMINPITSVKYAVPSAALVSNAFIEKYVTRLPYSIVAGPNYGKIIAANLVGPDYNYSREDRDELEPFGVNCLLYVPRKGTYINSNQTAKQNPVTALSKVHIRELVTFLQDEIEILLQNYQWEFNTQSLRDTIRQKADTILQTCQFNNGIHAFSTQCDEKNNTPEVVENEMIILDYAIEPTRGAGKMIQQLTIYKTGGLSTATL